MKSYLEYINENKNQDIINEWFGAVSFNNIERVKMFIKQGVDINAKSQNKNKITALQGAASRGYIEIVKLLLAQPNINVNLKDSRGESALMGAAIHNEYECVKLLLQHPNIDIKNGKKGLIKDYDFINVLSDKSFLKDPDMQKKILANGRKDIIDLLDDYDLAIPGIEKDPESAIKSFKWGLTGL